MHRDGYDIFINCSWVSNPVAVVGKIVYEYKISMYLGRNNTLNNTKTRITQNRKKNIQSKETYIKRIN